MDSDDRPPPRSAPGGWPRWDVLACVAAGGASGAVARYGVGQLVPYEPGRFPAATFMVNASGCLAIGALVVVIAHAAPRARLLRPLLGAGVVGGYTTFSTYALESRDLLARGESAVAGLYLVASVAVGLVAVALGMAVGALVTRRQRPDGAGS